MQYSFSQLLDKVNAHIIPFDMDFDVEILKDKPSFKYDYDNEGIRDKWREILGNTVPVGDYKPQEKVRVQVISEYMDVELHCTMRRGEELIVRKDRAMTLMEKHFVKIIGE